MSTLHTIATRQYTEHYARMNPALDPAQMPRRVYRNMDLMYGELISGLPPASVVGDLGCGTGYLLYWLAAKPHVVPVGVDACETQAEIARSAVPRARVHCADVLDFLKHYSGYFAALFCIDVLEHMEDDERVLELLTSALRSLRPGGFLVCRVPNAAHILGSYSRYLDITHHRSFTSHSLRQAFQAAGFKQVRLIPARSSILLGKLRLGLEHVFHQALFLLGGYTSERIFTQNVTAVGFKEQP